MAVAARARRHAQTVEGPELPLDMDVMLEEDTCVRKHLH